MKIIFLPKTRVGKWSVVLILYFFLFLSILELFISLGERGGEGFFSNLKLAFLGLASGLFALVSFVFGIAAFIKKERSIFVYTSVFIGFLVLLFVLGEIIFPH